MRECKKRRSTTGFIDPHIVFKHPSPHPTWHQETKDNVKMFFDKQRDKKVILFPYNMK